MPTDARKLSDWLQGQSGVLQKTLSRTQHLVQMNRALHEWLREPWADAIRIANVEGDAVIIHAAHAAAATLLRFRQTELLAWVQQGFVPGCTEIQIKVRPETYIAN